MLYHTVVHTGGDHQYMQSHVACFNTVFLLVFLVIFGEILQNCLQSYACPARRFNLFHGDGHQRFHACEASSSHSNFTMVSTIWPPTADRSKSGRPACAWTTTHLMHMHGGICLSLVADLVVLRQPFHFLALAHPFVLYHLILCTSLNRRYMLSTSEWLIARELGQLRGEGTHLLFQQRIQSGAQLLD